jgi:TRAP-type C4-dicarboxylate transport system permease large subunit
MTRISVQAILAGGLTGLLVTNLLAIPFVAFVVMNAGLTRLPKDQMQVALAATIQANGALHAMQILLGTAHSPPGPALPSAYRPS